MYALNNAVYIYHLAQTVRFGIYKKNESIKIHPEFQQQLILDQP